MAGDVGNIFLIGFMGSGKTTVGRLLAQLLGWDFVDLDENIERRESMSIERIFEVQGEAYFRDLELRVLKDIAGKSRAVVALGGGTPTHDATWPLLRRHGIVVYLSCRAEELYRRLQHDENRPLLRRVPPEQRRLHIQQLLLQREPYYRRAGLVLDTGAYQRPKDLAEAIATFVREHA